MEENKPVETTTTQNVEEKQFTQKDLNNLVAKESKSAVEKLLKELGVEDVKSAKDGLAKFKEIQDAQKSEYDKMKENYDKIMEENKTLKSEKVDRETSDTIAKALIELNIDSKYKNTVRKLMNFDGVEKRDLETLKPLIEKVIDEELPMLRNNEKVVKVGLEKEQTKINTSNSAYLEAFKKMKRK